MAILGRNTASGFASTFASANQIVVYRATLAAAGHLDELWASIRSQSGTFNVRCVIFAADGASGEPGTLLAVGADISIASSGSRATIGGAVVAPINLPAANYWLGVHSASNFVEYDDNGSGLARRSTATDTFVGGTDNPWVGTLLTITGSMQVWGVLSATVAPPSGFVPQIIMVN